MKRVSFRAAENQPSMVRAATQFEAVYTVPNGTLASGGWFQPCSRPAAEFDASLWPDCEDGI